jgi:PAS domain S-box-containing protein
MRLQSNTDNQEILGFYGEGLLTSIPLPTFLIDKHGYVLSLNRTAETLLGITESIISGHGFEDMLSGEKTWHRLVKKIEDGGGKATDYKIDLITKEGLTATVRANIKQERNSNGVVVGYILIGVPELNKKAEHEILNSRIEEKQRELDATKRAFSNMLFESEDSRHRIDNEQQKTRATLMGLGDGVILIDKDGGISMVNSQAEEILEIKESEISGKRFDQLAEYPRLAQLHQVIGQYEHAGYAKQPIFGKKEFMLGDQQKKYYQLGITQASIQNIDLGTIIELHDITQEKAIDRMKSEFISIAAHQLRTPLTGINWSLDAVLNGEVGDVCPELRDLLKQTAETAMDMTRVVNDLLNVSKLEQNKSVFNFGIISPADPLKTAFYGLASRAKSSNIEFTIDIADNLPKVKGDNIKLQMAFYNLLENAIKYSREGGKVSVSAISTVDANKTKVVQISIKDNGIGIGDEEKEKIFSKFFRADNAIKFQTEGSGMGLFIVRQLVDGHGGKVWLESKKDQGTTFYVNLPVMEGCVVPDKDD